MSFVYLDRQRCWPLLPSFTTSSTCVTSVASGRAWSTPTQRSLLTWKRWWRSGNTNAVVSFLTGKVPTILALTFEIMCLFICCLSICCLFCLVFIYLLFIYLFVFYLLFIYLCICCLFICLFICWIIFLIFYLSVACLFGGYLLFISLLFIYFPFIYCLFSGYLLFIYCLFDLCLFVVYLLFIHSLFILLIVFYLLSVCLFIFLLQTNFGEIFTGVGEIQVDVYLCFIVWINDLRYVRQTSIHELVDGCFKLKNPIP